MDRNGYDIWLLTVFLGSVFISEWSFGNSLWTSRLFWVVRCNTRGSHYVLSFLWINILSGRYWLPNGGLHPNKQTHKQTSVFEDESVTFESSCVLNSTLPWCLKTRLICGVLQMLDECRSEAGLCVKDGGTGLTSLLNWKGKSLQAQRGEEG